MTYRLEILCTCRKYSLVFLQNLFTWSYWHPEFPYFSTYPASCYKVSVVSHSLLCTLFMHCTADVKSDLALCLCCTYFAQIWKTDRTAMQKGVRPLFHVCVWSSGFFRAIQKWIIKSKGREITRKNIIIKKISDATLKLNMLNREICWWSFWGRWFLNGLMIQLQ